MPLLAVFRMANLILRLLLYTLQTGKFPYAEIAYVRTKIAITQFIVWWYWWTKLFLLMLWYILGHVLQPLYIKCFVYIDSEIRVSVNRKYKRKVTCSKRHPLMVMCGRACVYTNVYNVVGKELAMLRIGQIDTSNNMANKLISTWNYHRNKLGMVPPHGWPLSLMMMILAVIATTGMCMYGYKNKFWKFQQQKSSTQHQIHASVYQSKKDGSSLESKAISFDADSSTIIVDNSANCIIWNAKENFIKESYIKFGSNIDSGIATAVGSGSPVGMGTLRIGWDDDDGKFHKYEIKGVYHVPTSPVNILGLSVFSKSIGDYDQKGTRINSSGQDSVFIWDHLKYTKTFQHSEAHMPEMVVNNGYSKFHRICNYLDFINPISSQCYHTHRTNPCADVIIPYSVGEEIMYRNGEHVENAIIEEVFRDEIKVPKIKIKFKDDRTLCANIDNIKSPDETDVSIIPSKSSEYASHAKCLTAKELNMLKHPLPLSKLQKDWKMLHDKLGHIPFATMDKMVMNNILPRRFEKLKGTTILCPSCIFGRMRKRPWRTKSKASRKTIRKDDETYPGAKVSTDQLVVAQPGLVPRLSGRHTNARICGATGFIDHHSGYSFSSLQTSLDGEQTLQAKIDFETHANTFDVQIRSYRADNGRFAEKSFRDSIKMARQTIDFCGVGAHHQNGIIERHFQTLSTQARTILLHAKSHWPTMISVVLWPFAYKYAEYIYNHMSVDDKGLSPIQKFCNGNTHQIDMDQLHTWGCPCYVLDSKLQSGASMMPKWEPRSRLGIYLGHSPCHAGTVALVLNPSTLHVSPQFHVAFDDNFATVPYLASAETPPVWEEIVQKSEDVSERDYDLAKLWMSMNNNPEKHLLDQEGDGVSAETLNPEGAKLTAHPEGVAKKNIDLPMQPTLPDLNEMTRRKSSRIIKPTERVKGSHDSRVRKLYGLVTVSIQQTMDVTKNMKAFVTHLENVNSLFDETICMTNQMIFATISANNDVYTLKEMLRLDEIAPFVTAMIKEIEDHEVRDHWEIIERMDLPKGAKTILSVWAFKLKRFPDGQVMKHKARLNAHGGMQRWGVDYWETYAPVVNWISVRLMMAITIIHKLETKSIDFVLAFPQAELDRDVFMELPYGFQHGEKGRYVLRLKRNLYGLADASFNWFQKLCEGLESENFVKSEIDQCVFIREDCIVLMYVDDMIAISRENSVLEKIVVNLQNKNYILTDEGSLTKYLGVDVKYREQGGFELVQPFLIQRIIELLKLDDEDLGRYNTRPTPAVKPLLCEDLSGEDRKHNWNYRKAIGMLTYLQGTT